VTLNFSIIDDLVRARLFDSKNRIMPSFVEPAVQQLVTAFGQASADDRSRFLASWHAEANPALAWFARKLAGRAVRARSEEDLVYGLTAIAILAEQSDPRDLVAGMALFYSSAERLGIEPSHLFRRVAQLGGKRAQDLFMGFLKRDSKQKEIEIFGFSAGLGPEGFDYIPLLPEYGGPTPFDG
jgi:hypothetical protein